MYKQDFCDGLLDVDQQFRLRSYVPSPPRRSEGAAAAAGGLRSTGSRSRLGKSNSVSSPVPGGSCSTACSSGYVSADDEHGTLLAYGKRESVFSETSSIASPESFSDTPSSTPSPELGLTGPFSGWAAAYDACSSNFDGGVTDAWSALYLGSNDVQASDAWLGNSDLAAAHAADSSMLAGDRSILKDLLVHAEAEGSPSGWPSRLDSPSSAGFLMDCVDTGVASVDRHFSKPYDVSRPNSAGGIDRHSLGAAGSTVALFQQIFADGILEPTVGDAAIVAAKIKKEPSLDDAAYGIDAKQEVRAVPAKSSRLASGTGASGSSSFRSHHHYPPHRSASQQSSPKLHHSAAHYQNRVAYIGPDRKPFIKSESCVFASQNDHTYTSKVAVMGGGGRGGSSSRGQSAQQAAPRRWNSILEYFLLTKRSHDPQKGSNAALASEGIFSSPVVDTHSSHHDADHINLHHHQHPQQQGVDWQQPPPHLLKRLLTEEMEEGGQQQQQGECADEHLMLANGEQGMHGGQPMVFGDNFSLECDFDFSDNLLVGSEMTDLDNLWEDGRYKVSHVIEFSIAIWQHSHSNSLE